MSNPVVHAFFLGRALAESLNQKFEDTLANALSELGKFDAEQRERLRQFINEAQARAEQELAKGNYTENFSSSGSASSDDLQERIDELRAEIARLRAELKTHRDPK